MALIHCPDCGREVSDKAPACPSCGCPIAKNDTPAAVTSMQDIEKYLDLALKAIQGENSDQVEQYCQTAIEIDPQCSRAWELEARGILFKSSLSSNKIPQAIAAAANAVNYSDGDKSELAISLYKSICSHISGLYSIAKSMPTLTNQALYIRQVMQYYCSAITDIPNLPVEFINKELEAWDDMEATSKKAILPTKRIFFASHINEPAWADQMRATLKNKGVL